ncbi:sigma factor-like helix-turn-helix DNA-binding protein [Pseudonocardia sp. H11422]|uniref:sigma factor-like helix-turn-helix DNA-binding protein n=1 Tax=Pseudonocardia sp. H11422 TaxID=2835866 RepID=UPI001BDC7544|nr:sigma factor-like helix-turn-helix DNA-binding protein [Pseudonocardia sp. H11422]
MPGADIEIDSLVLDAIDGDRRAIARILRLIHPRVIRYCAALLRPAAAEEVAQQVCLAVFRALPTYPDRNQTFLAFVHRIAVDEISAARQAPGSESPATRLPQLPRLLGILPPRQREIVLLRIVWGLSTDETARVVDCPPGAVRLAQHRALAALRVLVDSLPSGASLERRRATPQRRRHRVGCHGRRV